MSIEVWISIVACVSGLWGVVVTFWAPNTKKKKVLCMLPFLFLAFVGVKLVNSQSNQRILDEQQNKFATQRTQESLARAERELGRVQDGMRTVQLLLSTSNSSKDTKMIDAVNTILTSLRSPFTDTGTTLTTNRNLVATTIETTEQGNGYVEMTDVATGQKLTLSVGNQPPTGKCISGSLNMVSTGGVGSSLYLCEGGDWVAITGHAASSASQIAIWSAIVASIAALSSLMLVTIHRRNLLETVRPELVISGWSREKIGADDLEQERIIFQQIKNVGRGAALHVNYGFLEIVDDKPIVALASTRTPIIGSNEAVDVNSSITLYWKNIKADHQIIRLSLSCLDTRGVRYSTDYLLMVVPLRPDIVVTDEIAPGVMLGMRKVKMTSAWMRRLFSNFRRA